MVVATLDAAITRVHRVLEIANELGDAPILEGGNQATGGVTKAADGSHFSHGITSNKGAQTASPKEKGGVPNL
jgi:hypothetical protein